MPVNAMIARGFEPVGRDLPEIGNMLYQRRMSEEQNARRNELLQMEREQNAARNAMLDEKMGWAREDRALASDERAKAAEEAEIRDLYRMGDIDAIIRKVEPRNPQLAEAMRRDPARTAEMLRKRFGDPGPIEWGKSPSGGEYATQEGKMVGGVYHRPQFAPDRPQGPPSGYRWKKDGTLEPIPGGPGDKPNTEAFGASDTNAIRGLVTTAFGGVYDPVSGNITGIKREDSGNLNRVTARASNIYKSTPGISHAEAVEQALSELQGGAAQPAAAPSKGGRRREFASQAEAEAANAAGKLEPGDTVYINGRPMFKVE